VKNCADFNMYMSEYIDDQLDHQQRSQFEKHLKNCNLCKSELSKMKLVVSSCKDIQEEELPEDFKCKIHERLVNEKERSRNKYIKIFSTLAAGFVLIILLKGLFQNMYFMPAKSIKDECPQMMKAESFEESEEIISFAGESKDDSINDGNMAEAKSYQSQGHAADAMTSDSARSFVKRNSSGTETNNLETDSIRTVNLTLEIKNPVLENENIKLSIINSGAELINKEKCAENEILLYAKVPNQTYDAFIMELKNEYGTENLIIESSDYQDITAKKESLSIALNSANNEEDNTDEKEAEKQCIREELEKLSFDADYTFINLKIVEKD
jgi:hypothetical protein